ncbi:MULTISPECIES: MCE family protein [unclassified Pseudonocardia]|uniref:MCE family protein n=1 Tax=unclassified Pseudonocardia TaxID=2619320 RepID=UPI0001FFE4AA|nr:MCE family protein [Pseudonocardia sp. Ae707_Ps1]OLM16748.1 MCE-family protein Mce1A [Pseudonocardia sp. Ae707_Ps1]
MDSFASRFKYRIYALILVSIIVAFFALCGAAYAKAFTPYEEISLRADRTGLQMYPGNRVQMRGVDVGEVGDVNIVDGGNAVDISLRMNPDTLSMVPADARVQLSQLTAFGAKTVGLTAPELPSGRTLAAGDQLTADRVTVEVNTLFQNLDRVLDSVEPAKVASVLGNASHALQGRGETIGQTASELAAYLRKFNENLPQLQRTASSGADLANLYADVTPDLLSLVDDVTVTSRTVVEQQANLDSFFFQLTRFSNTGRDFFLQNGDALTDVMHTALPTTGLLRDYSPMFACFLQGVDDNRKLMEANQGGRVPGVAGMVSVQPGGRPYDNPEDLPEVGADNGPNCHGLPDLDGTIAPESLNADVDKGGEPNENLDNTPRIGDPPAYSYLFGPLNPEAGQPVEGQAPGLIPGLGGQPAPPAEQQPAPGAPAEPGAPAAPAPGAGPAPASTEAPAPEQGDEGLLGGLFGGGAR